MPLLSIVMPVKNGMPFIEETIKSVLSQDFLDYELIISDDRSSDGTTEFLRSISDERVKLTSPSSPLKVDAHWTFVSMLATGNYIKLLCADDILTPSSLQRQMSALIRDSNIDLIVSSRKIVNERGKTLLRRHGRAGLVGEFSGIDVLRKSFLSGTNIIGEPSGIILKTSSLKSHLPWNAEYPYMLDFEFYTRLLVHSKVKFIESVDSEFRVHGNSISALQSKSHFAQFLAIYHLFQERNPYAINLNQREEFLMRISALIKTYLRTFVFKFARMVP